MKTLASILNHHNINARLLPPNSYDLLKHESRTLANSEPVVSFRGSFYPSFLKFTKLQEKLTTNRIEQKLFYYSLTD